MYRDLTTKEEVEKKLVTTHIMRRGQWQEVIDTFNMIDGDIISKIGEGIFVVHTGTNAHDHVIYKGEIKQL